MSLQIRKTTFEWISRRISLAGFMSRREAEECILAGKISVNGRIVRNNFEVSDQTTVEIDGIQVPPPGVPRLYGVYKERKILCCWDLKDDIYTLKNLCFNFFNKNLTEKNLIDKGKIQSKSLVRKNEICGVDTNLEELDFSSASSRDVRSKSNDVTCVRKYGQNISNPFNLDHPISPVENLIVINKLDVGAEGIVLLTNDGDFAHTIMRPQNNILSVFLLRVHGRLPVDNLRCLRRGITINKVDYGPVWVEVLRQCWTSCWLKVTLVEKKGRDLHILFKKFDLEIKRFKRYAFGPYRATSLPTRTLNPLKIHKALRHLITERERRLSLLPSEDTIADLANSANDVKPYPVRKIFDQKSCRVLLESYKPNNLENDYYARKTKDISEESDQPTSAIAESKKTSVPNGYSSKHQDIHPETDRRGKESKSIHTDIFNSDEDELCNVLKKDIKFDLPGMKNSLCNATEQCNKKVNRMTINKKKENRRQKRASDIHRPLIF